MPQTGPVTPSVESNLAGAFSCPKCGKTFECDWTTVMNCLESDNWPQCCGEVMLFHAGELEQIGGQSTVTA
jgi:hypothetical protein